MGRETVQWFRPGFKYRVAHEGVPQYERDQHDQRLGLGAPEVEDFLCGVLPVLNKGPHRLVACVFAANGVQVSQTGHHVGLKTMVSDG